MKIIFNTISINILLGLTFFGQTVFSQTKEIRKPAAVAVAGTHISLAPPSGFVPASLFPGFQLESMGASIMVNELPGPFEEITAAFSKPSEMSKKGMLLLEKQAVKSNGRDGLMAKTSQSAYGLVFLKWHFIIGDEKETVIISATFPKQHEAGLSAKMKASLLTAVWDRNKVVSPTEGLNYAVDEVGDLKLAKRMSNALLYTKNGIFPNKGLAEPSFVVAQAISKTSISDTEQYARARILQITQINEIEIERTNKISVDNLEGYEIVARGKDNKSGQPVSVYQVMLFEKHGYFLMQGFAGEDNREMSFKVFKETARTFRRNRR